MEFFQKYWFPILIPFVAAIIALLWRLDKGQAVLKTEMKNVNNGVNDNTNNIQAIQLRIDQLYQLISGFINSEKSIERDQELEKLHAFAIHRERQKIESKKKSKDSSKAIKK